MREVKIIQPAEAYASTESCWRDVVGFGSKNISRGDAGKRRENQIILSPSRQDFEDKPLRTQRARRFKIPWRLKESPFSPLGGCPA
jgi:hypothetical protein